MTIKNLIKTLSFAALGASTVILSIGEAAKAALLNNSTGLTNPDQTISFSEISLSENTPVTTQFSSFGVTFNNLYYNPQPFSAPNITGDNLGNFILNQSSLNPFSIKFSVQQNAAAFAFITNPGVSTLTALLNGVAVETFNINTNFDSLNNFYGFTDINFDEIVVTAGGPNGAALIDSLQTRASTKSVPEPTFTIGLLALGAGSLLKRKKQQKATV